MMKFSNIRYYAKKRQVTPLTVAVVTSVTFTGDNRIAYKGRVSKNASEQSSLEEAIQLVFIEKIEE